MDGSHDNRSIMKKIQNCKRVISIWKKSTQTNSEKLIKELQDQIDRTHEDDLAPPQALRELNWKLCEAYREEDFFWFQKSRQDWMALGDKNTKYFHASTKQRRARNRIIGILDQNQVWIDNEEGIEKVAVSYFDNLFSSSTSRDPSEVLRDVPVTVTPRMNDFLTKEVTEEEVKRALFSLNPRKAPGPDGLTALFYQRFWDIIRCDLTNMVKNFFRSGIFDGKLNETNICLIPEGDRPREMSGFRPISLCNVSYKVVSKILSLRLKKFLPELISETQSAFVAGRLITDNILIAQENFHALRSNPANRKKFMGLKTDMSKAYERVEWEFLRALMEKMGFDQRWVVWIMQCITSVTYRVLLNGDPKGRIIPSRGIRQGDPISPYLFILCTEALIALVRKAESDGKIQGVRISNASPRVSHLLFADDSLFFCKADVEQSKEIIEIIRSYGRVSGQEINLSKSSIMFGNDVSSSIRQEIKRIVGM